MNAQRGCKATSVAWRTNHLQRDAPFFGTISRIRGQELVAQTSCVERAIHGTGATRAAYVGVATASWASGLLCLPASSQRAVDTLSLWVG